VGATYNFVMDENNRLMLGLDINKLLVPVVPPATGVYATDSASLANYRSTSVLSSWFKSFNDGTNQLNSLQASLGAEYAYNEQFFVRAGYFYEDKSRGNRQYFSVGAGFSMDAFQVNLSYLVPSGSGITRNPLSNTIRVGLLFNIGGK
jgi:opacity protein-like surface antigen